MKKILVVEDEKSVRENIVTLLTEEGYKVFSAQNGEQGINIAKSEEPDLIICDIMMPGKDGYAVLTELCNHKSTKTIPFIFLTAKVERSDLRLGMELGADDYLFKPFKIAELLKSVESRLKKSGMIKAELQAVHEKSIERKHKVSDKLFINVNGKPKLITISEIIFIAAENQYTVVNLT